MIDTFFFGLLLIRERRIQTVAENWPYSLTELFVLELVSRRDGIIGKNIARFLGKQQSSISETINHLELKGLLNYGETVGLKKPLHLTSLGKQTLELHRTHCTVSISDFLTGKMSDEEKALCIRCFALLSSKQDEFFETIFPSDQFVDLGGD